MIEPISWRPSQYWEGNDGQWSTFPLRVGQPAQTVRLLISSSGTATSLVIPRGCPESNAPVDCPSARGSLFDASKSQTWKTLGNFTFRSRERSIPATYGLDDISLGFSDSIGAPKVNQQVNAGFTSYFSYLGSFGLNNQPTNFTTLSNSSQSYLASAYSQGLLPSQSWAYTAGAHYNSKGSLGSLTLGGYDNSRLVPNNVSFTLASDVTRDIVPSIRAITAKYENGTAVSLLPSPVWTYVDSSSPFIYLPLEACQLFERTLGLTWNATASLYQIDDALHERLLQTNPRFNFQVANDLKEGSSVEVSLPYAAFDLTAKNPFPLVANETRYFPLRRAANESQYTLGRTFLQEAYLIVNYDHSNFSIHQAIHENGSKPKIIALRTAGASDQTQRSSPKNLQAIIGGSVGGALFLAIMIAFLLWIWRRHKAQKPEKPWDDKFFVAKSSVKASGKLSGKSSDTSLSEILRKDYSAPAYEVGDASKHELIDMSALSGSGRAMHEMATANQSQVWEMATSTTPHRSLTQEAVVWKDGPRRSMNILVHNRTSWKTSTTFDSSAQGSIIETTISGMISPLTTTGSSPQTRHSRSSRRGKSLNLNRPLPPLPQLDAEEESSPPMF